MQTCLKQNLFPVPKYSVLTNFTVIRWSRKLLTETSMGTIVANTYRKRRVISVHFISSNIINCFINWPAVDKTNFIVWLVISQSNIVLFNININTNITLPLSKFLQKLSVICFFDGQACWWCQLCSLRQSLSKASSRNLVFKCLPICSKMENPLRKKTLIKFYLATQFLVNVAVKWRDIIHFKIILKNISEDQGFILASVFLFLVSLIILERTKAPWKIFDVVAFK